MLADVGADALGAIPGLYRGPDGQPAIAGWPGCSCRCGTSPAASPGCGSALTTQPSRPRKYRWLSSDGRRGEIGSGPRLLTWPGPPTTGQPARVLITEGEIKCNIVAERLGIPVIGVPGVNAITGVLPLLRALGATEAVIAYDRDAATKPAVATARRGSTRSCRRPACASGGPPGRIRTTASMTPSRPACCPCSEPIGPVGCEEALAALEARLAAEQRRAEAAERKAAELNLLHTKTMAAFRSSRLGARRPPRSPTPSS